MRNKVLTLSKGDASKFMRQRLQKILAQAGCGSRRNCEKLIAEKRVCVNGVTVSMLGSRADPESDSITLDGERINPEKRVYLMLNKPRGYLCTSSDPWGRRIVRDLLPGVRQRLYTVGRLDRDAEGLLLLTNDGQFAQRIAHPRCKVDKTYQVRIRGELPPVAREKLERGISLDGKMTLPARVGSIAPARGGQRVTIAISEGRKRQIKRMFLAVGCPVRQLRRVAIGGLRMGNLPAGSHRFLRRAEIERVFAPAGPRSGGRGGGRR